MAIVSCIVSYRVVRYCCMYYIVSAYCPGEALFLSPCWGLEEACACMEASKRRDKVGSVCQVRPWEYQRQAIERSCQQLSPKLSIDYYVLQLHFVSFTKL